ncbi:MAG: peptide deformylase [Patescibacteria group bacterium]|jgi:peptide deformylase
MKSNQIYQIGDQAIRLRSKKVIYPTNKATKGLIKKMISVMRKEHLVGIAAPQVGVNQRVFVTQPRSTKFRDRKHEGKIVIYINPRILRLSKEKDIAYEGCGSVANAGIFGRVNRSKAVTIQAQNQLGDWFTLKASGFLARIIQHEYDHLEGMVFLDRVKDTRSLLGREAYFRKSR